MQLAQGSYLAFDFGLKRVGVALGNSVLRRAQALCVLNAPSNQEKFDQIGVLMQEWQAVACIVGLPLHTDGTPHAMSIRCRRFANQLHGRFGVPVFLVDERYSSVVAAAEQGGQDALDAHAAALILQQFFDEQI